MTSEESLKKQIKILERRKAILEQQEAYQGINVEPSIKMEIEDIDKELVKLNEKLSQASGMTGPNSREETSTEPTGGAKKINWTMWGTILTGFGVVVAVLGLIFQWWSPPPPTPTPISTPSPYATSTERTNSFSVSVISQDTDQPIKDARIILELGGKAPKILETDSNGTARFIFDRNYTDEPARLRVEADGYELWEENIDLSTGGLPLPIKLSSKATPQN